MRYRLVPHPRTPPKAAAGVDVRVLRLPRGSLGLTYCLTADLSGVLIPDQRAPIRRDGLWQHSCFEAFAGEAGAETYHEFNLSPSREWGAYRFDGYRTGMRDAEVDPPFIDVIRRPDTLELRATVSLPEALGQLPLRLGLSAVVEEKDGTKSYWALAHTLDRPDFHQADCFTAEVPAAEGG